MRTPKSQCGVMVLEQRAKTPLPAVGRVSTCSTKTRPQPSLRGTLSSPTLFQAAPGHGAALVRAGEQKRNGWTFSTFHQGRWILSERAYLHFCIYIILPSLYSLVISDNGRLRASGRQWGHDLAFPCPEVDGLLPSKDPHRPCVSVSLPAVITVADVEGL